MRILIADDHDLFREALVMFLKAQGLSDLSEVGSVDEIEASISAAGPAGFDLVLLDYEMPGMDGLTGLARVRAAMKDKPVAILSGTASPAVAREAIEAGARGFLPKTMGGKSLAAAIQFIAGGDVFVPYGFLDQAEAKPAGDLTAREFQVLRGLTEGKSNKDIARQLELQEVTIKLHVKTLCRKLGARNRTQAAMIARDRRLLG
jgi:two-component system nitrate/nitrite response regulator NarL